MSQLRTGWDATNATYLNAIPAGPSRNVSQFDFLQFRATVNFTDVRNPVGTVRDLSVRFTDGFGTSQSLRVGQFSNALFYPPGTQSAVPKILQHAVRLPLASLTGVNLTNISEVALLFDQQASGALLISDIHFYQQPGGGGNPGADYFTLTPCRVLDTRITASPLLANTTQTFTVAGMCGVPVDALAVSAIPIAVDPGAVGDLRVYPTGQAEPLASAINFVTGKTRANNAIVPLGLAGQINVR
jgi:hypothetical protein